MDGHDQRHGGDAERQPADPAEQEEEDRAVARAEGQRVHDRQAHEGIAHAEDAEDGGEEVTEEEAVGRDDPVGHVLAEHEVVDRADDDRGVEVGGAHFECDERDGHEHEDDARAALPRERPRRRHLLGDVEDHGRGYDG